MVIQLSAVVHMLRYLFKVVSAAGTGSVSRTKTTKVIGVIMIILFIGHMAQAAVWAALFRYLGEFGDYATAFYHSLVNFASLGYGDIVMSEEWRLLGAIEASAGVLMFGLSAGAMLSIMSFILAHDTRFKEGLASLKEQPIDDA
jgi:hypothetical protein